MPLNSWLSCLFPSGWDYRGISHHSWVCKAGREGLTRRLHFSNGLVGWGAGVADACGEGGQVDMRTKAWQRQSPRCVSRLQPSRKLEEKARCQENRRGKPDTLRPFRPLQRFFFFLFCLGVGIKPRTSSPVKIIGCAESYPPRSPARIFKKLSEKELSEGFEQSCRDVTFLLKRSFWPLLGVDGRGARPSREPVRRLMSCG